MSITNYSIKKLQEKNKKKYGKLSNKVFDNYEIQWHEVLSSTMDVVNKNIKNKKNIDQIIVANYQEKGHGRFNRKWYSEKNKNLLVSIPILVKKDLALRMPIILSFSVFQTIKKFLSKNYDLKIKWPNDIFLNSKKISGMITKNVIEENLIYINFGVGININVNKKDLSGKGFEATSLFIQEKKEFNIEDVLYVLLCKISNNLNYNENIFSEWKNNLYIPKNKIYLNNNKDEEYSINGVDEYGNLLVNRGGKNFKISYGEISFHD